MIRWLAFLLVLSTSGCASWHTGVSVETVLRDSRGVAADIDREPAANSPAFQQPLRQMRVNSAFGRRWRRAHAGVDLKAREGTPIYAAADGVVVYASDQIYGYGLAVIVRHRHDLATLYAHASELRVSAGDHVTRGQCIAYAGESGNATGPHLHFEIRDGLKAVDPLTTLATLKKALPAAPPPPATTPAPAVPPAAPPEPPPAEVETAEEPAADPTRPPTSEDLTRQPASDDEPPEE